MSLKVIAGLYGFFIALVVLIFLTKPQNSRLNQKRNEWLFENFFEKLYDAIFGDADPLHICKQCGLKYDEYMFDCNIVGKIPNLKKEAMMRVVGLFSFVLSLPISVVLYSPAPLLVGCAIYFLLCSYPVRSTHSAAERKKTRLISEMPRFVDLLLSALEINLPIEIAITQTADSVPCVLSEELKTTFAETKIGAKNWQQALESIAQKYEIDQLSDFVLNIITAFNKGVSVTDAVSRELYSMRQTALLTAKERTAKMTSSILFPLLVFKIIPLIILLMTPIMIEAMSFYGS